MATPMFLSNYYLLDPQLRGSEELPSIARRPLCKGELSHKRRRCNVRRAALPLDSETLLQAATVASLSSLATSLWMGRGAGSDSGAQQRDDGSDADGAATVGPQEANSAKEIWERTWSAFSGAEGDGEGELIQSPLLYIQGLKGSHRAQLLALALASLQAQIEALRPSTALFSRAQWRDLCQALLATCTAATALAWLGYVPPGLASSCRQALQGLDMATLESSGVLAGGSAWLLDSEPRVVGNGYDDRDTAAALSEPEPGWFGLQERLPLYCSVLRLLSCGSIEGVDDAEEAALSEAPPMEATPFASSSTDVRLSNAGLIRQQAQQLLELRLIPGVSRGVRGWAASTSGARGAPQLLSMVPSALQDMAVLVADAVADAYLSEAAPGMPAGGIGAFASESMSSRRSLDSDVPRSAGSTMGASSSSGAKASLRPTSADQQPRRLPMRDLAWSGGTPAGPGPAPIVSSSAPLEVALWPTFVHPRLASSRQLQRFCNRVILRRWAHDAFTSVVDAYEDRLRLFTLSSPGPALRVRAVPLRRAADLASLIGVRYWVSLVLELADLATPALGALWERAIAGVGWLLTSLVGRAAGMVLRGVKMGLAGEESGGGGRARRARGRGREGGRETASVPVPVVA